MGSWYETCSITHLPIRDGDKMVVVVLNSDKKPGGRRAWSGLLDNSDFTTEGLIQIFKDVAYEDYGQFTGMPSEMEDGPFVKLYFHAQAWEDTIALWSKEGVGGGDDNWWRMYENSIAVTMNGYKAQEIFAKVEERDYTPPDPHLEELIKVNGVLGHVRRTLFDAATYRGSQNVYYRLHKALLTSALQITDEKIAEVTVSRCSGGEAYPPYM